ncbi:MAG: hypothetical protein Q7O66_00770 [Dehalococcoidia bacterium]|nr:hypothetical protein [Dehalococcoidia bacterium]
MTRKYPSRKDDPEWFRKFMEAIDESEISRIRNHRNQREALELLYRVACENTNWDDSGSLVDAKAILVSFLEGLKD